MGLIEFLRGETTIGGRGIQQVDTEEYFAIPLKRLEEDQIGLRRNVLTLEKNLSVMTLGQPGSGKTSTITFLAKQMQAGYDEPVVIFDYKGDYADKGIYDPSDAVVLAMNGSTEIWNVFREGSHIRDYRTIAEALFQEEADQSENKFFTEGARDLFMACLYHLDNSPDYPNPTNDDLLDFIFPTGPQDVPADRIRKKLLQSNNRQVKAAASELDPNNPETATNMYQTLRKRVARVFDGDFAKRGDFSIREYMENPEGKTLVLDMSGPEQDVMAPMFRIFLDWSIKLGLNQDSKYTYFILDEFDEVGELQQIRRLLSTGRAQLTEAVIGVQSRAQLESVYGEAEAQTILENCPQKILMRTDDDKEYIREQIGKEKYEIEQTGYEAQVAGLREDSIRRWLAIWRDDPQIQEEERYPIEEQEIGRFDRGEGVFTTEQGWVWGRFPLWEELSEADRRHLSGEQNHSQTGSGSGGTTPTSTSTSPVELVIGSETVSAPLGEPIGTRICNAYVRDGGDPNRAGYVHREHIQFDYAHGKYLVTALGANETKVNQKVVQREGSVEVTDGDRLKLAERVSAIIRISEQP